MKQIADILMTCTVALYALAAVCLAVGGDWKRAVTAALFSAANAVIFLW